MNKIKIYKFNNSEDHWIAAYNIKSAIDYFLNCYLDEYQFKEVELYGFEVLPLRNKDLIEKLFDEDTKKDISFNQIIEELKLENVELPTCIGSSV